MLVGVLGGRTMVVSLIGVIELHSSKSMVRRSEARARSEWDLTVSPVVVDIENNLEGLGRLQTEGYRADQMTYGTSASPCRADFDSSLSLGRQRRR